MSRAGSSWTIFSWALGLWPFPFSSKKFPIDCYDKDWIMLLNHDIQLQKHLLCYINSDINDIEIDSNHDTKFVSSS